MNRAPLARSYSGTVKSISKFGAFIDIGCHSEGLCHVSRLADDYVESVGDVVKAEHATTPGQGP